MRDSNIFAIFIYLDKFGIGNKIIKYLWKHLGLHTNIVFSQLKQTSAYKKLIFFLSCHEDFLNTELRKKIIFNIGKLINIRCYRGMRHKFKYPTRGQRTRSNAKTSRKLNRDVTALVADLMKKINPIMRRKYIL